jgi:hypothetical protein
MPAVDANSGATNLAMALGGALPAAPAAASPTLFTTPAVGAPAADPLAATMPLLTTALATTGTLIGALATPGATGAAAAPVATGAAPVATATPQRLTTVAPGGQQSDANLVEATLNVLRGSQGGAAMVDRLLAVGARINVISD